MAHGRRCSPEIREQVALRATLALGCVRATRDDRARHDIRRVRDEPQQVYGPRNVWKRMRHDGRTLAQVDWFNQRPAFRCRTFAARDATHVITVTVTQQEGQYQLDGRDSDCASSTARSAVQ